jgi:lysophospholipase L1-like esterase
MPLLLEEGAVVVFQGDSITDCGRNRDDSASLGAGYAMMTAGWYQASHPDRCARFMNLGVSGDRVRDLQERWQADCLGLRPSWVSILVGINDCWRRYDSNEPTSVEAFHAGYRDLLTRLRKASDAHVILMEPFLLHVQPGQEKWREDLDPKIAAVRDLAAETGAFLVPLDRLFAEACKSQPPAFWAADGVHPTPAGHALICRAWLDVVGAVC